MMEVCVAALCEEFRHFWFFGTSHSREMGQETLAKVEFVLL